MHLIFLEGDSNVAFDAHQVLKVELTSEIRRRRSDLSNSRLACSTCRLGLPYGQKLDNRYDILLHER